jgi:hypothetical protein
MAPGRAAYSKPENLIKHKNKNESEHDFTQSRELLRSSKSKEEEQKSAHKIKIGFLLGINKITTDLQKSSLFLPHLIIKIKSEFLSH